MPPATDHCRTAVYAKGCRGGSETDTEMPNKTGNIIVHEGVHLAGGAGLSFFILGAVGGMLSSPLFVENRSYDARVVACLRTCFLACMLPTVHCAWTRIHPPLAALTPIPHLVPAVASLGTLSFPCIFEIVI